MIRFFVVLLLSSPIETRLLQEDGSAGAPVVAEQTGPVTLQDLLREALESGDIAGLERRIAGLGAGVVPDVLELLETPRVETESGVRRLEEGHQEALLGAIEELGRASLLEALSTYPADSSDELPRRSALRALARVASPTDLDLALVLSTEDGRLAPDPELLPVLADVVERLFGLSPGTHARLLQETLDADPGTAAAITCGVGAVRTRESLDWLADLLGYREDLALVILSQVRRVAAALPPPHGVRLAERVREFLYGEDGQLARAATHALGSLQDFGALPELIQKLGAEEERVREDSLSALRKITGLTFPGHERIWGDWLASEERWYDDRAPVCYRLLESPHQGFVLDALRELVEHRYLRHETALRVAGLLESGDPQIRRAACQTLRGLDSGAVELELALLLSDPEPEVARTARQALLSIAGPERLREIEEREGPGALSVSLSDAVRHPAR